jgi:hypothetical protein
MAFGQQSGPPATHRQVNELLGLLQQAGHSDFRDARGPMGFTQRQAGGKFTRDEADAFIEQLQAEIDESEPAEEPAAAPKAVAATSRQPAANATRLTAADRAVRAFPAEQLAAELQRRGWIVVEP